MKEFLFYTSLQKATQVIGILLLYSLAQQNGFVTEFAFSQSPAKASGQTSTNDQSGKPDHTESVKAYKELVKPARTEFEKNPTIENKVNLATALLLHAELATRPKESQYTTANDHFEEGLKYYEELQSQLASDSQLEELLVKNPTHVMRFDALRFRLASVKKKQELSRENERKRLSQLREIVKQYRDVTSEVTAAMSQVMLAEGVKARAAIENAEDIFGSIEEIVDNNRDYYLLGEEPRFIDKQIIAVPIAPFTDNYHSQLSALKASAHLTNKSADPILPNQKDVDLAIADAEASVRSDTENALGHYMLARALETKGVMLTHRDPTDNNAFAEARRNFEHAIKSYQNVVEHDSTGQLIPKIKQLITDLQTEDGFLERAKDYAKGGDADASRNELREGIKRHQSAELWFAWAEAARRADDNYEKILDELRIATTKSIVKNDDYRTFFIPSKVEITGAHKQIAQHPLEDLSRKQRERLAQRMATCASQLRHASSLTNEPDEKTQVIAFLQLARAIELSLGKKAGPFAINEYEQAKDVSAELLKLWKKQPDRIELGEAVVAGFMALGRLSVELLPNYRDDAVSLFSTAINEHAKIPVGQSYAKMLGFPLLHAMRIRPADADRRQMEEERSLRAAMQHYVDGSFALYFGNSDVAAASMKEGLKRGAAIKVQKQGEQIPLTAELVLAQTDGLEISVYAEAMLEAFYIETLIENGNPDVAVIEALDNVLDRESSPYSLATLADGSSRQAVRKAIENIDTPMDGYAVGRGLEAWVVSMGFTEFPERIYLLKQAESALRIGQRLLSNDARSRYPSLVQLMDRAQARISDPEYFLKESNTLRSQYRLQEALAILADGVAHHPQNDMLWRELMQVAIDRADTANQKSAKEYLQAKDWLGRMQTVSTTTGYEQAFWAGYISEKLGDLGPAKEFYVLAQTKAANVADLLRAKARFVAVKIRTKQKGGAQQDDEIKTDSK